MDIIWTYWLLLYCQKMFSSAKSWNEARSFIVIQLNHTNNANFIILEMPAVTSDKSVNLYWPKGIRFSKRRILHLKWRHLWTVIWMLILVLFACINVSIYHQSSQAGMWDLAHLCSSDLVSYIYCINYSNTAPHPDPTTTHHTCTYWIYCQLIFIIWKPPSVSDISKYDILYIFTVSISIFYTKSVCLLFCQCT